MKSVKMRLLTVGALAVTAGLLVPAAVNVSASENDTENVIADNITIGSVSVGGMTAEEAEAAVEATVEDYLDAQFTLVGADDKEVTATGEDLGLSWGNTQVVENALNIGKSGNLLARYKDKKDLEKNGKAYDMVFTINEEQVSAFLNEHEHELNQEAENNGLKRENGEFTVVAGHEGIEVNVDESVSEIKNSIEEGWGGENLTIALAVEVTEPIGTVEELEKVQDVLGTFNTDFSSSSAERIKNIENAVSFIDGTVLYPGEEFSVADTIGPLDAENGYELAGAYENGATVQSYGGGVCQVSTTLYNAVLGAELEVTERSSHSMQVAYVEPSRDAAIAGDYKNFKFRNSSDAPIYIEGYTSGKNLYFSIFGEETRPSNRVVTYESEIVSESPRTYQFTAVAEPIGAIHVTESAHIARTAKLWKIVTVDGVEESREVVNNSKYNGSPQMVSVGTASDNPEACAAINAALATGDAATIYSTIAQYSTDPASAANAQSKAAAVNAENAQAAAAAAEAAGTTAAPQEAATADPAAETGTSEGAAQ